MEGLPPVESASPESVAAILSAYYANPSKELDSWLVRCVCVCVCVYVYVYVYVCVCERRRG